MELREVREMKPVKTAKKGLLNIVFSRIFIVAMLLVLQLIVFGATVTFLRDYATYVYGIFLLLEIISVIYIINSKSNSASKISWILLIMALPIMGVAFYLFMKLQPGTTFLEKRLAELCKYTKPYMVQDKETLEALRTSKPANANLAGYLTNKVSFPAYRNTNVKYLSSGEEKFEELKKQLRKAEDYIFMEYFIVEKGTMWNEILDILKEKVSNYYIHIIRLIY